MLDGGTTELTFRSKDRVYCVININCWEDDCFSQEYLTTIDFINELIDYTKDNSSRVFI